MVTVTGSGFGFVVNQSNLNQSNLSQSNPRVTCLFGRANVTARVISASQITCVAPSTTRYSPNRLSLPIASSYSSPFHPYPLFYPPVDSLSTLINQLINLRCCLVISVGVVDFRLSIDGSMASVYATGQGLGSGSTSGSGSGSGSGSALAYRYQQPAVVVSVEPNRGSSTGGTPLLLRGVGFVSMGSAFCAFGQPTSALSSTSPPALTPARVLNTTTIECESPPLSTNSLSLASPGSVAVGVVLDGYLVMSDNMDGLGLISTPGGSGPGLASGSGSGLSTEPPVVFTYVPPATIQSVYPLTGAVKGGTVLTVMGTGFVFGANIRCRFGKTATNLSNYLSI